MKQILIRPFSLHRLQLRLSQQCGRQFIREAIACCTVMLASTASAVVIDFDDLPYAQTVSGTTYGGLTWEYGSLGEFNIPGNWAVPAIGSGFPHSAPHNLINAGGPTLIGISFPSPVDISGAYIAVQGNGSAAWARRVTVHGYLQGQLMQDAPAFTDITTTPAWYDMRALTHVDRIVFETPPLIDNQAYYGLDDLTFTYIPEPAGISLGLLGLGGLLLRRSRRARER